MRHLYTGRRARGLDPVSAAKQAADYVEAIRLAACQPLVRMLLFFHVADEPSLRGLQSGLYYANDTPKPSLSAVAATARAAATHELPCGAESGSVASIPLAEHRSPTGSATARVNEVATHT
jgi:hypothetical protein